MRNVDLKQNFLILIKSILFILISLMILVSCDSKSDKYREWIKLRSGTKFTSEDMSFLINEFGEPIDTVDLGKTKSFNYYNHYFFYGPFFSKEESVEIINDYETKWNKMYPELRKWLRDTGKKQGLDPYFYLTDKNRNWKEYKRKIDDFKSKYSYKYEKKSFGKEITFYEFVKSYNEKFPDLTLNQSQDSIIKFLGLEDYDSKQMTSISYKFITDKNDSYNKRITGNDKVKDFKIDQYRDLRIYNDSTIDGFLYSNSYCITDKSKEKRKESIIGDWIYGDVQGAILFMKDGTYSMSNSMSSKRGKWWINCDGEIVLTNQGKNLRLTDDGIKIGSTIYRKR